MGSQGSRAGSTRCCQARKEPACLLIMPTKPLCAMLDARAAPSSSGLRERRGSAASGSRSWAGLVSGGTFTELGLAQHSPTPELQGLQPLSARPRAQPGAGAEPRQPLSLAERETSLLQPSLGAPEAGFGMESARPSPPERSAHSGTDIIISALLGLCSSVLERGINLHLAARFVQLDGRASLPWQHLARQGSDPSVPAGNVISSATVEAARKRGLIFNSRPGVVAAPQRCFPTPPRGSSRKNAAES